MVRAIEIHREENTEILTAMFAALLNRTCENVVKLAYVMNVTEIANSSNMCLFPGVVLFAKMNLQTKIFFFQN